MDSRVLRDAARRSRAPLASNGLCGFMLTGERRLPSGIIEAQGRGAFGPTLWNTLVPIPPP